MFAAPSTPEDPPDSDTVTLPCDTTARQDASEVVAHTVSGGENDPAMSSGDSDSEELQRIVTRNFRRFREELGWTQRMAANAIGVAVNTYQSWETEGKEGRAPSYGNMVKAAQAMGRNVDDFSKKDPPPPDPLLVVRFVTGVHFHKGLDKDLQEKISNVIADAEAEQRRRLTKKRR